MWTRPSPNSAKVKNRNLVPRHGAVWYLVVVTFGYECDWWLVDRRKRGVRSSAVECGRVRKAGRAVAW